MTHATALSPECQLVFLSAGASSNDRAVASLLDGPFDWLRAIAIAERENAMACIWRVLERSAPHCVPREIAAHMRKRGLVSDFRMMHLEQRLQATLKVFQERGVEVLLLKGGAFGATVYSSFAERPMIDVDVLIRPGETSRARSAVIAAGWQPMADPVVAELLSDHHHLPPFIDAATGLRLEIHMSLMQAGHPFAVPEAEIWEHSEPTDARFPGARVPSPSYLLYHACVHFAWSHAMQFGAWRSFRDTGELIRSGRIDWDDFVALAKRGRAASVCYWMLRLAKHMSRTPVPDDVLARLKSPTPEIILGALERHFIANIAPGEGPTCPSTTLARQLWRMAIRPAWSGHGSKVPWAETKGWELAKTGVRADGFWARVKRHVTGVRPWWKFVRGTLAPHS